jgi:hypothetical protein
MNRKEKIKSYDIMLQKHIDKKDFIKINRTFKNREENISGFLLALSKRFLLLQVDNEFQLNGYAIIPKDRFDSIRCNSYDKAFKRMYKEEGILDTAYGFNQSLPLRSWKELFSGLKKLDYHLIVECEDKDEPVFLIGPVRRVTKDKVSIQYYDPAGILEKKLTTVSYDDITIIKFGDRYSTTFRKYLKQSK